MIKRRFLQTLVATMVTGLALTVAAQPATAATVVQPGASGSTCSVNEDITTNRNIYWQVCTWASGGTSPRVWFTAHFGNRGGTDVRIDLIDIDFNYEGDEYECNVEQALWVRAHSTAPSVDHCWFDRSAGAWQAAILVDEGTYEKRRLSPTLHVR